MPSGPTQRARSLKVKQPALTRSSMGSIPSERTKRKALGCVTAHHVGSEPTARRFDPFHPNPAARRPLLDNLTTGVTRGRMAAASDLLVEVRRAGT